MARAKPEIGHPNGVDGATALVSDGFSDLSETGFTKILCNPPYHVDFSVPKRLIEKGFNRLVLGGSMMLVCTREAWYRKKLQVIFGNVRASRDDDYIVFQATKTSTRYARMKRELNWLVHGRGLWAYRSGVAT